MTCIVGMVHDNKTYMGCDSLSAAGWDKTMRRDAKMFLMGDICIGYTSSYRMGQILEYHINKNTIYENITLREVRPMEFMVTKFIPCVREVLKEHGYLEINSNREEIGNFMIGFRGKIFTVEPNLQVCHNALDYESCGCGAPYAKGALHTYLSLQKSKGFEIDPFEALRLALESSEDHSCGVQSPFTIICTENKQVR